MGEYCAQIYVKEKALHTYDFSTAAGLYCLAICDESLFLSPRGVSGSTKSSGFSSESTRLELFFVLFLETFVPSLACFAYTKSTQW